MLKKVLNLRYVHPQKIIVLEIAEQVVKITLLEKENEKFLQEINLNVVECFAKTTFPESKEQRIFQTLEDGKAGEFFKALQEILASEAMQGVSYAIVKLASKFVFTTQLSLPRMPDKELTEAIRWEQQRYLPWEEGLCYSNYMKLNLQGERQNILLAAVQKEFVQVWENVLQKAGLVLIAVTLADAEELWDCNLLPQGRERLRKPLTKFYQAGAIACVGLTLTMLACTCFLNWRSAENLAKAEQEVQSLQVWQQRYELHQKQALAINGLQKQLNGLEEKCVLWSEVLPLIAEALPKNCWLTAVKQRENLAVEVHGKTLDAGNLQQLLKNLQETFTQVQLLATHTEDNANEVSYTLLLHKRRSL